MHTKETWEELASWVDVETIRVPPTSQLCRLSEFGTIAVRSHIYVPSSSVVGRGFVACLYHQERCPCYQVLQS